MQKNPRLAKAYYDMGLLYSQEQEERRGARGVREVPASTAANEDAASRKDAEERLKTFKK